MNKNFLFFGVFIVKRKKSVKAKLILCVKTKKKIEYYQVSVTVLDENTRNREFKPLEAIKDNFPKYILTLDDFDFSKNGIICKNIIDWLLEK